MKNILLNCFRNIFNILYVWAFLYGCFIRPAIIVSYLTQVKTTHDTNGCITFKLQPADKMQIPHKQMDDTSSADNLKKKKAKVKHYTIPFDVIVKASVN